MIVYWSNDPDTTRGTYSGQDSALWRQWLKEKGVKMVFIDPFHNYTNAVMGGKWIAPRLGTDTAIAMAIAFVWITEDTYNKDYVADRTIGFDEVQAVRHGRDRRRAQDAGVGGRGVGRRGPRHPDAGPRMGGQADHPVRRLPRRRGRRLPRRRTAPSGPA